MKLSLLLCAFIVFISCSKTDDSAVNDCNADCTIVAGRIVRDNAIGIPNVSVEFYFEESATYSSNKRIIARGSTNETGYFRLKGYINNEELGNTADGTFWVSIDESSVGNEFIKDTQTYSNVPGYATGINTEYRKNLQSISSRDTLINYNLTIPQQAPLILTFQNFDPSVEMNNIQINTYLDIPENTSDGSVGIFNSINADYNQQNFQIETVGAQNFSNILYIRKRKNGEIETETITFFVDENTTNEILIEF